MTSLKSNKGMILGIALILAAIFALVSYANLALAVAQAEQAQFWRERPAARYAAEAGVIIVKERLWLNPNYGGGPSAKTNCPVLGSNRTWTEQVDSDGAGIGPDDLSVTITLTNCGQDRRHNISAQVLY